jgi:hypothetical protein
MSLAVIAGIAISCAVGVGLIATGCIVISRCASVRSVFKRRTLDKAFTLQDESDSGSLNEERVALRRLRDRERF